MGRSRKFTPDCLLSGLLNKKLLSKGQELREKGARCGPGGEGLLSSPEDAAWWESTFVRCPSAAWPQQDSGPVLG